MVLAFVDANVLAAPFPRTILYQAAPHRECDFSLVYSPFVEEEAERHQKSRHVPVSTLRDALGWQVGPDATDLNALEFVDTDPKDQPVLGAAVACGARFLVTGNVRHFGRADLDRLGVSAVHPGLFLAYRLTSRLYAQILHEVGSRRAREPREPLAIHRKETSVELPHLFTRFPNVFGETSSASTHHPPSEIFRGSSCVRCSRPLVDPVSLSLGLGPDCRMSD